MKILRSALKHGCSAEDISHAIGSSLSRVAIGDHPRRWFYVGVDSAAPHLELVTVEGSRTSASRP